MSTTSKILFGTLFTSAMLIGAVLFSGVSVFGALAKADPLVKDTFKNYTFFSATTTTAVSTNVNASVGSFNEIDRGYLVVAGAERATFYFSRGDTTGQGNAGKTVFDVDVSPDGTTWHDFNQLIGDDVSATATTTVTISVATSTVIASMDIVKNSFYAIRCTATETTDGEHTCKVSVDY